jgi:hypothetical protein
MSQHATLFRFFVLLSLIPAAHGQQAGTSPSSAVIAKLKSAKTVFVSNLGADGSFSFDIPGGANVCYNELYASLKQAGNFELVEDPDHADLILAIQCTERLYDITNNGRGVQERDYSYTNYPPYLNLAVLEPGNKTPLYTIRTLAGRASNIPKGKIAMANSINGLTTKVMAIVGKTPPLPAPATLVNVVGLVPPRVVQAKKVFLRSNNAAGDLMAALTASLNAWGHYTIVDSPQQADIVLVIDDGYILTAEVFTPSEKFQLWTVTDPNYRGYGGLRRKKMITAEIANMMKAFKTLNGEP